MATEFVKFNIAKVGKISIGKTGTFVRKRFKRVIGIFLEKKINKKWPEDWPKIIPQSLIESKHDRRQIYQKNDQGFRQRGNQP